MVSSRSPGDTHLGGEYFGNRVKYFVKLYKKIGTDVTGNDRALLELKRQVEKAKRALSSQMSSQLEIESVEGDDDFSQTLTPAKFAKLNNDLFRKTLKPVEQVLKDSGKSKDEIDDAHACHLYIALLFIHILPLQVVLVGGSTCIPKVQSLLKDFFNGKQFTRASTLMGVEIGSRRNQEQSQDTFHEAMHICGCDRHPSEILTG